MKILYLIPLLIGLLNLCELAGLPIPKAISGISQVPVLNNPETTLRTSALTYHGTVKGKEGYSIVTDRCRFTRWNEGLRIILSYMIGNRTRQK
jgi:hypothetical protein